MVIPYTEGLKTTGGLSTLVAYFPFENGAKGYRYSNATKDLPIENRFSPFLASKIELAATSSIDNAVETRSGFQGHAMYFDSASQIKTTIDQRALSHQLSTHITMAVWVYILPGSKGKVASQKFM
jgi:hypothetical protein